MESILNFLLEREFTPEVLDSAIEKAIDLNYLNILLDIKLNYLQLSTGHNKIHLDISRICLNNTNNTELLNTVLKKALKVSKEPERQILGIISYIDEKCSILDYELKVTGLLNVLIRFCHEENKLDYLFKHLKYDFVVDFLLNVVTCNSANIQAYEGLRYLIPLLPKHQGTKCLNNIFQFCKKNTNLSIFCAILNQISIDLVGEDSCFNTDDFWCYLETCLSGNDTSLQKQGISVLVKCISNFSEVLPNKYVTALSDPENSWNVFLMLLDIGREKQLHLVKPALSLLNYICNLHPLWHKCIYKVYLNHSQNVIVYGVAIHLMKQNYKADILKDMLKILLPAINKSEFSDLTCEVFVTFQQFCLNMSKAEFEILLEEILIVLWNPVSLWKIIQGVFIAENKKPVCIDYFQDIVSCVMKLPHIYIRSECLRHLIQYFWDGKSFFKMYRIACSLKKYKIDYYWYLQPYEVSEETIDFIINELLILNEDVTDNTDKIEICFMLLKKLNYDIVPSIIGKYLHKLTPHVKLYVWQIYFNLFEATTEKPEEVYFQVEKFFFEYFTDHLTENTTDCLLDLIHSLEESTNFSATSIIEKLIVSCLKPSLFTNNQVYISLAFLNRHSDLLQGYFDDAERKITIGRKIIQTWKDRIVIEKDPRIYKEYIYLVFAVNKKAFSLDDTKEIVELFKSTFDFHSNNVLELIYEKLALLLALTECSEMVLDFISFCFINLKSLKKDQYYKGIVINFIRAVYSETYLKRNNNNLPLITNYLLELCAAFPIIRLQLILSIKPYVGDFIIPITEIYLQGVIITKEERTEYNICQEIWNLKTAQNTQDLNPLELSEDFNPNILNATTRILALDALLTVAKHDIAAVITCLRKNYLKFFKKRYFPNSEIHLKKLRIAQATLLLLPYVEEYSREAKQIGVFLLDCFLEETNQNCIKQIFNWILILLLQGAAFVGIEYINRVISVSAQAPPSVVIGLIPTFYHLALSDFEEPSRSFNAILTLALPWTMGPQFKLRIYAQDIIRRLISEARENDYKEFLGKYQHLEACINTSIEMSGQAYKNTLKTDLIFLNDCNPLSDNCVKTILHDIPRLNSVTPAEWEDIYYCITTLNNSGTLKTLADNRLLEPKDPSFSNAVNNFLKNKIIEEEVLEDQVNLNIQKKITPHRITSANEINSDFILIASLIDKPQNLGGLSRTCEAFGIRNLIFNDATVVKDKDFKSLSMSSDAWINVTEVKIKELREYILQCQKDGYCVIGAEQTAQSVKLNEFHFPKKTVLLLGNEKTGIPSELILLLNECLEIPQFGQTRSLNVHVAGATFIWEYAKQHLL